MELLPTPPPAAAPATPPVPPPRRGTPWWIWLVALAALGACVYLQRPLQLDEQTIAQLETGEKVLPPTASPEVAVAKLAVAYHDRPFLGMDLSQQMLQSLDPAPEFPGLPPTKYDFAQDRFRVAILLGKLGDQEAMNTRLVELKDRLPPASPLHQDIDTARAVFDGRPVDSTDQDALLGRHGWFGRLLLDDGSPGGVRDKAAHDGARLLRAVLIASVVLLLLLGAGVVSFFALGLMMLGGTIKAWPTAWRPLPGQVDSRRLWFETVGVFLGGFLALKLVITLLHAVFKGMDDTLVWVSLLGQWALVLVIFWPRLRGLSRAQFLAEAGWHRGRGFFREVGAGIASYLAMLPVYLLMAIIVVIYMLGYAMATGKKQAPMDNRMVELASGSALQVALVFALATIWAPLVEETIFRGALYRFVRGRTGPMLAAFASAAVFAALHGYLVPQLVMVGTIGFCFALMREWRGSIIGSMTAHGLHNALVFSFTVAIAPIMDG